MRVELSMQKRGGHAAERLQPRMTAKCAISDSGAREDMRRIEWRGDVKARRRRLSLRCGGSKGAEMHPQLGEMRWMMVPRTSRSCALISR
jgi:hypothetical protein